MQLITKVCLSNIFTDFGPETFWSHVFFIFLIETNEDSKDHLLKLNANAELEIFRTFFFYLA